MTSRAHVNAICATAIARIAARYLLRNTELSGLQRKAYLIPTLRWGAMGPMTKLDEGQRDGIKDEQCAYDATDGPSQIAQL